MVILLRVVSLLKAPAVCWHPVAHMNRFFLLNVLRCGVVLELYFGIVPVLCVGIYSHCHRIRSKFSSYIRFRKN